MTDRLRELHEKVRRREYRRAKIDRGIGSAYASIRSSFEWWSQPAGGWPSDEVMEQCLEGWRERFGAEQVSETLQILVGEVEACDLPPYRMPSGG